MLNDTYPSPDRIAWFKREYQVTHTINLPGVIKAYSLEHIQQHWVMIIEDFGGDSLNLLNLAGQLDWPDQI